MLRSARFEDSAAIARVLLESRRAFLPYAPSAYQDHEVRQWVAEHLVPGGRVVVWEEQSEICAVLATSEDDVCAWIDQLYVLPGSEDQGIGTALLRYAHAVLRRPIRLYTFQQNAGARRFYERNGYEPIAFSDGHDNEEKCPDVLYELSAQRAEALPRT